MPPSRRSRARDRSSSTRRTRSSSARPCWTSATSTRTSSSSEPRARRTRWPACGSGSRSPGPETIARIAPYRPPGSVSTVSVSVVTAALADPTGMAANVARVDAERDRLARELRDAGWSVGPSVTNFLLVDFGTARAGRGRRDRACCGVGWCRGRSRPAIPSPTACGSRSATAPATTGSIAAARDDRDEAAAMTTPLGTIDVRDRADRRVTVVPNDPRDGRDRHDRPRRQSGDADIATGRRVLRPPARARSPTTACST